MNSGSVTKLRQKTKTNTISDNWVEKHTEKPDVVAVQSNSCMSSETASKFAESVNCQGLPQFLGKDSGPLRRFVWLVLVLGGLAMAVYQIQDRVSYYLSKPTTSDVHVINNQSIPFPVVTICNYNAFMKSALGSILPNNTAIELVEQVYPIHRRSPPDFSSLKSTNKESVFWLNFLKKAAQKPSDMVLEVTNTANVFVLATICFFLFGIFYTSKVSYIVQNNF